MNESKEKNYTGGGQKTGVVFTPKHIAEFFCELVDLDARDVLLEPCCGNGGVLVTAMEYMMSQRKDEQLFFTREEHKKIRILGIEERYDLFKDACNNIKMHGGDTSKIYHGDCFDNDLMDKIREEKPTVCFLNPPYNNGPSVQLGFIENAMELLQNGGRCVAICQMSTAISSDKKVVEVRKRLLEKHTLKAVFSMPQNLFYPVGVVTSVLVFEAKTKKKRGDKTFFGYFRDDGYVIRKHKGRLDDGSWAEKKEKMLSIYRNKRVVPQLSVMQCVTAKDEWCAEAYMETDYSTLNENDFLKTILEYVAFQVKNGSYNEDSF